MSLQSDTRRMPSGPMTADRPPQDPRPLPPGWTAGFDPNWKVWYYINMDNNSTQWTHPADDNAHMSGFNEPPDHGPPPAASGPVAPRPPHHPPRYSPSASRPSTPGDNMSAQASKAFQELNRRHHQLRRKEDALRRAAANIAAENSDAASAQRRKELALAAERYRDQREIMEAEWRLKRQERRLQAEQDSQRRREIQRQMAHDQEMRQRLLRAKDERDRTAHMLYEERRRTRQQQRSKMRVEEDQLRRETAQLAAQRLRERHLRTSEELLRRAFGYRLEESRLQSLARRLSLYAAKQRIHIQDALERFLHDRLHRNALRSEAELYALESDLDGWAQQRGYEMDRMSDAYYVNSLLNNSYSDPYWTDYYNRYGFLDSYEPNMPCNNYGDEFYWDDPLLSSSPGLSGYSSYDRYDPYGSAAGLDDFSRMGDRGLGSPYNSLDPFDSYGGYASMSCSYTNGGMEYGSPYGLDFGNYGLDTPLDYSSPFYSSSLGYGNDSMLGYDRALTGSGYGDLPGGYGLGEQSLGIGVGLDDPYGLDTSYNRPYSYY